jgi:hypothetical protein
MSAKAVKHALAKSSTHLKNTTAPSFLAKL